MWGEKYYTFLVTSPDGFCLGENDPIIFSDDDGKLQTLADYSQFMILHDSDVIRFGDEGLWPSLPYYYDYEECVGYFNKIKLGEEIAIWASKEKYTYDDFKAHDGDSKYFEEVSRSFVLCYIAVLKEHTTINYGMYDPTWAG